ncbi:UNVERIFIED_CONTAM: Retrovirus-related Pol polyprotein from transposon opus [Sesamum latifolium]|uniref:Retrovirus-related Pol polyprotein from transposon opus n=1 Tax=Sesamum latifolium TaxID=2727402 RepID=A0AAW2XSE8_9LAMI
MIDATTGHEALFFMDGSSGYNQIRMAPADEELMGFRTPKGIYCYKVMPFGLKNAGAIYQRSMQRIFNDMLHKNVECYVDDLVVKSKKREDHLYDLRKVFERLRRYQLKMNPLNVPLELPPKNFLDSSSVNGKNDEGKENALYYLSRTMTPNELKYSPIEKLYLALIFAIHKLKHYFQSHSIRLVSKVNPLKYDMTKSVLSDRLARWYLQLQQFEITYVPQKAIKGQVLADFLADHPMHAEWELSDDLPDEDVLVIETTRPWKIYFDGASHKEGADYAKGCQACQFHANLIHQPPEPLHPTVASWPFDAWGLDVVGPTTKSSGGHLYILATTDYFSKWAEAVPLKEVKKENVTDFIRTNIIYRYGVPSLLKKVVAKSKRNWHERIGEALWTYRTTVRAPTQSTPYALVYGVETVLPLEQQIPSLRISSR